MRLVGCEKVCLDMLEGRVGRPGSVMRSRATDRSAMEVDAGGRTGWMRV